MATSHRRLDRKIRPFEELQHGKHSGQPRVPRSAYPEIVRRAKIELNSVIGRDYGVTGIPLARSSGGRGND